MTATVVTSVGSLSRIDRARAWLETRDAAEEVLILGASLGAANELARSLAKTRGAAFGWHRLTLPQLAASIASPVLTERELASISQIGAEAAVARLLHRLRIERRLGRFQPIAHTPGFPRAITAVLTELRLAQLSSEAVATATPDVSPLLAAYEAELAELALADWPEILTLAAEGVLTHRLSGLPLLMLDVPIASEAELAFLRVLAIRAPEILATVPAADKLTLARVRDDRRTWRDQPHHTPPAPLPSVRTRCWIGVAKVKSPQAVQLNPACTIQSPPGRQSYGGIRHTWCLKSKNRFPSAINRSSKPVPTVRPPAKRAMLPGCGIAKNCSRPPPSLH
jgi:hypothetical protein